MTRRAAVLAGLAAVLVAGAAAVATVGLGGGSAGAGRPSPPATALVTRQTLVDSIAAQGQLGYGPAVPLRYAPPDLAADQTAAGQTAADPALAPPAPAPSAAPAASAPPGAAPAPGAPAPGAASATTGPTAPASAGTPPDDQGLITWLPPVGVTIGRGGTLFRVDDRPVVLLIGALPVYRTVRTGVRGPDVEQLERNLAALGYRGFTVDTTFAASTAAAVRAWQHATGQLVTGTLAPGRAVYAPAPIRVAAEPTRVGDPATGEILDYTGTVRQITVDLPVAEQQYAGAGTAVTVDLPDGRSLAGRIATAPVTVTGADGTPAVRATVTIPDQAALGSTAPAEVTVHLTTQERKDVLIVPVVALVALAEGGYGVEVAGDQGRYYVAVTTGLFADGRVEVTSSDLREGMRVVVPR